MTPVITAVAPAIGHTGGRTVVEIAGSGFREPAEPPATGIAPPPAKTVRVLFGGVAASDVEVLGPDLIYCRTPIHDAGAVDVVVQNLGETPAQLLSAAAPYALWTGGTLDLAVQGEAQTLTVLAGEVATPGAATAAELAAILNRARAVTASPVGGQVLLRTDQRGPTATLAVTGGSAAAAVGFPAGTVSGTAVLEPIAGESATRADGFTFARPKLNRLLGPALVMRQLVIELERQVVPNVHFATHTDYDPETGDLLNTTYLAKLPAIVLAGLDLVDSPDRRVLGVREVEGAAADRVVLKAPEDIVDMTMTLVAATDDPNEGLNLFAILRRFFRKNGTLRARVDEDVEIDSEVPATFRDYELEWRQGLPAGVSLQGENENLITVTGSVAIRGVPIADLPLDAEGTLPAGAPAGAHEGTAGLTWTNETTELGTERKE